MMQCDYCGTELGEQCCSSSIGGYYCCVDHADKYLAKKTCKSALNTQEGGDHYKKLGPYQPWEVLSRWMTPDELKGFMKGTVIAYLARENDKGGMGDIRKAAHTMQIYLELVDKQASKDRG